MKSWFFPLANMKMNRYQIEDVLSTCVPIKINSRTSNIMMVKYFLEITSPRKQDIWWLLKKTTQIKVCLDLKRNFIFVGTFDALGYIMKIYRWFNKFIKGAMTLMKGCIRPKGLYILNGHTIIEVAYIIYSMKESKSKFLH